jgi:two-component system cell cycle sensor histidine kinase/response regulator CckA
MLELKFFRFKRKGGTTIRTRLALMTAVLIAGISVFIYLYFPSSLEERARHALAAKGRTMSEMLCYTIGSALEIQDFVTIDGALDAPLQDKDLVFIVVRNDSGHVVSAAREGIADHLDYLNAQFNNNLSKDGSTYVVTAPIVRNNVMIGDLYIGLSLKEVRTAVTGSKATMLGLSILIFVIGMGCVVAISTVITAPLHSMMKTVEQISRGDLSTRAEVPSLYEVQQLAESFNMMVENVESRTDELELEVHQRTKAEEAFRVSEARYRLLFDGNPYPLWVYDVETLKFLAVNNAAVEQYGYSKDEFLSMTVKDVYLDERPGSTNAPRTQVLHKVERAAIYQHRRKDNSPFSVEITSHELQYENRQAMLVLAIDVTERKKLEEQFLRSQRMQSIGTLAGGIAHDLNNVLAPMLLALEIFKKRISDPPMVKLLDAIQISTKRGSDIVKQVLTFARGFEGEKADIQLRRLVNDLEQVIRDTFPRMIHIKTTMPKELWTISGDYTQLYQVLMNLCVNARDAMQHGGNLTIESENVYIDEQYASMHVEAKVGPYVVMTIADSGMGMPPGIIDKIFEPFFTTKEVGKGTGLGLSTVIGIVKSHGGFVNVYSEVGKGSRFKIYLPALETTEVQQAIKELSLIPNGKGELVLVVDDEPAIREVNKVMLEEHGYRVMTANDGTEALALGAQYKGKIDVVITDMMMPFMDGPSTIRALKKLDPNLKFMVISGLVGDQQLSEDFGKDNVPFLQKPFSTDRLLSTLQEVLAG